MHILCVGGLDSRKMAVWCSVWVSVLVIDSAECLGKLKGFGFLNGAMCWPERLARQRVLWPAHPPRLTTEECHTLLGPPMFGDANQIALSLQVGSGTQVLM